jgi:glycosyltransferase involved in cell wall biosynthesis
MQDLMAALVAKRLTPFRLIWRSQGEKTVFSPAAPPDTRMRRFARNVAKHVDAVVSTSEWDAAALLRWGIPPERVRVEYLGVPDDFFNPTPRPVRSPERFNLVLAGRLVPWKGQATLIRAVGLLVNRLPNLDVWLVGGGDEGYRESLKQEAVAQGLSDRVRFLGHREDIPQILAEAHIAVHCSEREPFGLTIIEAMASRLPVLAAAVQGPQEILRSDCGVLVPPGNTEAYAAALSRMVTNWPDAVKMGQRAFNDAYERFRCATNVPRLERSLLAGSAA